MANQDEKEQPESFVHHLRRNGYTTVGIGKLSHSVDGLIYGYQEKPSDVKEMPHSWDRFVLNPGKWETGWNAFAYANGENRQSLKGQVKPYESAEVPDEGYPDGLILKSAVEELKKLKAQQKPFFLGVGFFKPHLPFNAPKNIGTCTIAQPFPLLQILLFHKTFTQKALVKWGSFIIINCQTKSQHLTSLSRMIMPEN